MESENKSKMSGPSKPWSPFKCWFFDRLAPNKVRVYTIHKCDHCDTHGHSNCLIITNKEDRLLHEQGVSGPGAFPQVLISQPYPGAPFLCPGCTMKWRYSNGD